MPKVPISLVLADDHPLVLDGHPFELDLVLLNDFAAIEAAAQAMYRAALGFAAWAHPGR